ncbi:hypothetical protein TRAPUB_340 [Trametes pubescens]|uniref:Uncharacterized protein n=1 Tax=Trametes pubescens TaxID=154538 RepID=A0A1M2VMF5_TRAPU|nr:hypothetical protein TRAPUB_340 [Trametes pubescens]
MAEPPKPPGTQRKSRVLAALDNPTFFSPNPATPPPQIPDTLPLTSLGLPSLSQTPLKRRLETPLPDPDYLALLGGAFAPGTKRKASADPENDFGVGASILSPLLPGASVVTRGFSLRYDQETAVRSIDRGGADQKSRLEDFVQQSINNAVHGITVKKAMDDLGIKDKKDLIPGMEVRLLPHQLIGVNWMTKQERASPHKGGLLADDMGLGKTVQMIATMVINQPTEEDTNRSTLIVVPAALMTQWKDEIIQKTNGMFEVHIQHGKEKLKKLEQLAEKDVVITTYQTLNLDFNVPSDLEDSDEEMQWIRDNGGPLSRMRWYRVILDEAQFIRNRGTRCSKAVAMLRSKYRWCLTGTPITNTLADIYGFLRFGRFRPWNDWEDFNEYVAKMQLEDAPLAGMRAQEILKPIILRRTKDAKVEGEPILQLPPKEVELVFVEFSTDERELYDSFEKRAQIQINRFIRNNTLVKNHTEVFTWILRLRQLCAHPHLVLEQADGFADPSVMMGSASDKELARATKKMGAKWVENVKKRFMARARAMALGFEDELEDEENTCPMCNDFFVENSGRTLKCGHDICSDCLDALATSPIEAREEFGNGDEQTNLRIEKEYETAAAQGLRPCPTCKKMQDLRPNVVFLSSAFYPSEEEMSAARRAAAAAKRRGPSPPAKKRKIEVLELSDDDSSDSDLDDDILDFKVLMKSTPKDKGKAGSKTPAKSARKDESEEDSEDDDDEPSSKGKGKNKNEDEAASGQPNEHLLNTWKQGGSTVESSAKMLQMIGYLKEWESSGDKIIVFSQWTSMLNLCDQIFARHGIRSLRYDGKMSRENRELTLKTFRSTYGPKVILVSIKCGGVGLNLVSANRVINLDLSWNYATESQAYDRVHRLGQEKEVVVKRLVIKNSIEERMLVLQETKTHLADAALGEGSGTKLQKLSVKQIKALFGMTRVAQTDHSNGLEHGQTQL